MLDQERDKTSERDGAAGGKRTMKETAKGAAQTGGAPQVSAVEAARTFSEFVALLMRDANQRELRLRDLEWMLLPAIRTGQAVLLRGRQKGSDAPAVVIGGALWARVSDDVDARLAQAKEAGEALNLEPAEWTGGDNLWLVALLGPESVHGALLEQLRANAFKDGNFKRFRD